MSRSKAISKQIRALLLTPGHGEDQHLSALIATTDPGFESVEAAFLDFFNSFRESLKELQLEKIIDDLAPKCPHCKKLLYPPRELRPVDEVEELLIPEFRELWSGSYDSNSRLISALQDRGWYLGLPFELTANAEIACVIDPEAYFLPIITRATPPSLKIKSEVLKIHKD